MNFLENIPHLRITAKNLKLFKGYCDNTCTKTEEDEDRERTKLRLSLLIVLCHHNDYKLIKNLTITNQNQQEKEMFEKFLSISLIRQ